MRELNVAVDVDVVVTIPDERFATGLVPIITVVPTETLVDELTFPLTSKVKLGIVVPIPTRLLVGFTYKALVFTPTLPFTVKL